jgi:CMP-N-acetylneuraminic acid synthetase
MNDRIVGFVPSKLNSQRLPRKNVRELGGVPLINYALRTLHAARYVSETVVYASNDEVMRYVVSDVDCRFVRRADALDRHDALVQDFVGAFIEDVDPDVVVLLHATSPFIRALTVDTCIDAVRSGRHSSAFAAIEARRFTWFDGAPLNYRLDQPTPRTQDLAPVLMEQSGLYVFTRELFESTGARVGPDPYIQLVDAVEGHDIDTEVEFDVAEALLSLR